MHNNEGWGLSTFIAFSLIFVIAILVISINAYKVGINKGYQEGEIKFDNGEYSYSSVENTVLESGKRYYNSHSDASYVTISTLIKEGYISQITDNKNNNCTGYVKFDKNGNDILYSSYIKCGNAYQTSGYMEEFDK